MNCFSIFKIHISLCKMILNYSRKYFPEIQYFQFKIMLTLNRTKNDFYANISSLFYDTNKPGINRYWVREAFCYESFQNNFNLAIFQFVPPLSFRIFSTKTQEPNNRLRSTLTVTEKLEFVRRTVSWIQGTDIMDSCFILNYGYVGLLPWPQVRI